MPGQFELLGLGRIVIDGREAYCDFFCRDVPAEDLLRLRAEWLPAATLKVVEQGGDVELDQLEIRQGPTTDPRAAWDWDATFAGTAGADLLAGSAFIAAAARSPVPLVPLQYRAGKRGAWSPIQRWFVRAPGTAWSWVDVDHVLGGDFRIELKGTATLQVNTFGSAGTGTIEVSVARVGSERNAHHTLALTGSHDRAQFRNLVAGTYAVRSLIRGDEPVLRGPEAIVDVREGTVAQLELDMRSTLEFLDPSLQSGEPTRVAIQAEIPPCWRGPAPTKGRLRSAARGALPGDSPSIELEFEMKKTRAGIRSVAVAMLEPGSWKLAIDGIPWSHEFKVDAQTRTVPVNVPPLVELPILCQDADTQEALGDVALFWGRAATHHEFFSNCPTATAPESGALRMRVAEGSVAIHARKRGYASKTLLVDARSGVDPVVIGLERACGVRLRFLADGFPVYTPYSLQTTVREIGGNGQVLARCSDQLVQQIEVARPGMYEITVAGLDPLYLQPDPIRVVVERGKFTDASVALLTR